MTAQSNRRMKPYGELLQLLDNSTKGPTTLTGDDLLDILYYCRQDAQCLAQFTEVRKKTWFQVIGKVNSSNIDAGELIAMLTLIDGLKLDPTQYFPRFYFGWEILMLEKLDAKRLIPVLETYHHLAVDLPTELVDRWCNIGAQNINAMLPPDLAASLFHFARLKVRPNDNYLTPCWAKCMLTLDQFDHRDLSSLVYAIGKLDIHPDKQDLTKIARAVDAMYNKFDASTFVPCLYGFALLGEYPGEHLTRFTDACYRVIRPELRNRTLSGLSRVMWSVGKLRKYLGNPTNDFVQEWFRCSRERMSEMSPGDLTLIMEGIRMLDLVPPNESKYWDVWQGRCSQVMPKLWFQAYASLLTRLHTLGVKPTGDFLRAWFAAGPQLMRGMYVEHMVELLRGIVAHKINPKNYDSSFMAAWQDEAIAKSFYFTRNLSDEIRHCFDQMNIPMRSSLESKLHD